MAVSTLESRTQTLPTECHTTLADRTTSSLETTVYNREAPKTYTGLEEGY